MGELRMSRAGLELMIVHNVIKREAETFILPCILDTITMPESDNGSTSLQIASNSWGTKEHIVNSITSSHAEETGISQTHNKNKKENEGTHRDRSWLEKQQRLWNKPKEGSHLTVVTADFRLPEQQCNYSKLLQTPVVCPSLPATSKLK